MTLNQTRRAPLHEREALRVPAVSVGPAPLWSDAETMELPPVSELSEVERVPDKADVPPRRRLSARPTATVLVAAAALLVIAVVHARGMYDAPIRFDDEGTYVSQALAVLRDGTLAPYTYWYDHPPLGWLLISGWFSLPGVLGSAPNPIDAGRSFMLLAALVTGLLSFIVVRRLGGSRGAAAAAVLVGGLSPLALQFQRMVLLDNLAVPLLLAAFALVLSPRRQLSAVVLAGVSAGCAVLCKETALLFLPFVAWSLWQHAAPETRRMALAVFSVAATLLVLLYPLYAVVKGELLPGPQHVSLVDAVHYQLGGRVGSGSVLNPTSDARSTVTDWLRTDPYLVPAGGLVGVVVLLARVRRLRALRPLAAALVFSLLMLLRTGYLPVPYVVALIPLAAIVLAVAVDQLVQALFRRAISQRANDVRRHGHVRAQSASLAVLGLGLTAVLGGAAMAKVEADWAPSDAAAQHLDLDLPYQESTAYIRATVPRTSVLVVDNVTWTDLMDDHYRGLVWFTKLDTDASVARVVRSWHDVDYVVATQIMYTFAPGSDPTLRALLTHSTVVRSWGTGDQRVDLRKVNR